MGINAHTGGRHRVFALGCISRVETSKRRNLPMWTYAILALAAAANVVGMIIAVSPEMKALSTLCIIAAAGAAVVVYRRRER